MRFLRFPSAHSWCSVTFAGWSRSARSMATHVERPPRPIIAPVGRPSAVGQRCEDEQLPERWLLAGGASRADASASGRRRRRSVCAAATPSGPHSGGTARVPGLEQERSDGAAVSADGGSSRPGGYSKGGGSRGAEDRRSRGPLTEAEKRALEVKMRRAPRTPRDPELERQKIEARTLETWIDDGSVRDEAVKATDRATAHDTGETARALSRSTRRSRPSWSTPSANSAGLDSSERLAQASEALDRERFQEAKRLAGAIAKEAPDVADRARGARACPLPARPVQAGGAFAGDGTRSRPDPTMMPVVADCYRALGRWASVDRVWREIKAMSPSHEVLAEGRIVAVGCACRPGRPEWRHRGHGAGDQAGQGVP